MSNKLFRFFIILFFSFTMYGFSRPASEEDETAKWRMREGIELTLDYVPVSAFVYTALSHENSITGLYGEPEIGAYHDANGDGYQCHLQFRTRGGGRVCLNFIWLKWLKRDDIPRQRMSSLTYFLFDHQFPD